MLTPVTCFTCGLPTGDKDALFRVMRADLVKEELAKRGVAVTQAAIDSGLQVECREILERLQVKHDCCRKTLVTAMIFSDVY